MNFIQLFQMLDTNQSTNAKRSALVEFIRKAHPLESALAVEALTGRRERRHLKASLLKQAAYQVFADESWLFEECYAQLETFRDLGDLVRQSRNRFTNGRPCPS